MGKEPLPIAVPGDANSSPPIPHKVSTVESAGLNNAYIWLKADYFTSGGSASGVTSSASTQDRDPSAGQNPLRLARAIGNALFFGLLALIIVNIFLLPMQFIAFGLVILYLIRQHRVTVWPSLILRANEFIVGSWMGLVATVLELYGMGVQTYGDVPTAEQLGEGALVISNHPSTADWVYLWSWFLRMGSLSRLKIVLKGSLHQVPIIGWALQCCRYLFLARDWEKDKEHMANVVEHWSGGPEGDDATAVQVLIFPEGTDLRPVSFDQSAAYVAREEHRGSLVQFQHVLQPRVTGFVHLVKLLRSKNSQIKAVYDLTIGSTPLPVTIENLGGGIVPSSIHLHTRRYELSSLPESDDDLRAWLLQRWIEKDARLEEFYNQQPGSKTKFTFQQTPAQKEAQKTFTAQSQRTLLFYKFSYLFIFGAVFLWHLFGFWFKYPLVALGLHVFLSMIWLVIQKKYGGMDTLILKVQATYDKQTQKEKAKSVTADASSSKSKEQKKKE